MLSKWHVGAGLRGGDGFHYQTTTHKGSMAYTAPTSTMQRVQCVPQGGNILCPIYFGRSPDVETFKWAKSTSRHLQHPMMDTPVPSYIHPLYTQLISVLEGNIWLVLGHPQHKISVRRLIR